jgi:tripartite-type tricarboxylate transporter receptor subunit TctC
MIVAWKAGSGVDITARIMAQAMGEYLPQPIVVTNIEGAVGRTGQTQALKARPDGYTLLWDHPNMCVATACKNADYAWSDFELVAMGAKTFTAMIANKDFPFDNAKDAIEHIKSNPGKVRWSVAQNSISHFNFLAVSNAAGGLQARLVPDTGGDGGRVISILGGNSDVTTVSITSAIKYVESGDMKLLAILSGNRMQLLPDAPTLKEQGYDVSYDFAYTLFAPKGIPDEVKKTLYAALEKACANPKTVEALNRVQCEVNFLPTAEAKEYWTREQSIFDTLAVKYNMINK